MASGQYEGTFTRWYCHEEMHAAHNHKLKVVGVMATDEPHGKSNFAEEKRRARTGGTDGGPVSEHVETNLRLLDDYCNIPYRTEIHETGAFVNETTCRRGFGGG